MTKHALLGASSAHRWLNCPPSARLTENIQEERSIYAEEGSLAHELAELKLRKQLIEPMSKAEYDSKLKQIKEHILYEKDMQTYTDMYVDYIQSIVHGFSFKPYIVAEKQVDYSRWVPEGFGTADCIIISGDTLYILDFKYGKGVPVSAVDNPQMMLYALGAYSEYSLLYDIKRVTMVIIQPRIDNISTHLIDIDSLMLWAKQIAIIAEQAYKGEGEFYAGEHCKFCKAKANCRARAEKNIELAGFVNTKPALLDNSEIGELLEKGKDIASWVKDLEEYALKQCLAGNKIDGWKAVEGKSNRAFKDVDKAFDILKANDLDETVLYEKKPISLSAIEKLLGKKRFKELLNDEVIKPPGKPTLVVESDKRDAISNQVSAESVFSKENNHPSFVEVDGEIPF